MAVFIDESDGIELIQNLQYHQHEDVYEKALRIIETFFEGEDEVDYDIAPESDIDSKQFAFGTGDQETSENHVFNFNQMQQ